MTSDIGRILNINNRVYGIKKDTDGDSDENSDSYKITNLFEIPTELYNFSLDKEIISIYAPIGMITVRNINGVKFEVKIPGFNSQDNKPLDVIEHNGEYVILTQAQIIVITRELNCIQYELPENVKIQKWDIYNKYSKLIINNDKIHYVYCEEDICFSAIETKINLILVDVSLETRSFERKIILECIVPTNYVNDKYFLNDILVYKNYIMFGIVYYDIDNNPIFQYNLETDIVKTIYINKRITGMHIVGCELFISITEDCKFDVYNISTLKKEELKLPLNFPNFPNNGYYGLIRLGNSLVIIGNDCNVRQPVLYIYEKDLTIRKVIRGGLMLKYFFKEHLGFEDGWHKDVKSCILKKLGAETEFNDEGNISSCKILEHTYNFTKKHELV